MIGNLVAFIALAYKFIYDTWLNRRRFNAEVIIDSVKAFEDRSKRAARSTTIAFGITAISFALLFGDDVMNNDADTKETLEKMQQSIDAMQATLASNERRIKKIEDEIWPPNYPGKYGSPTPSPNSPGGLQASLRDIKESLANLNSQDKKIEEKLERIIRAIALLEHEIKDNTAATEATKQIFAESHNKIATSGIYTIEK